MDTHDDPTQSPADVAGIRAQALSRAIVSLGREATHESIVERAKRFERFLTDGE